MCLPVQSVKQLFMKKLLLLVFFLCTACDNERIVQLPKINSTEINEVTDVSAVYIFYDETEQDSVLFNRKNLIGTTNWLVNVDKRLALKKVLPHLNYLQNKRSSGGMHKNELARNYFTCNNLDTKNLGFIDFTDTQFRILDHFPTTKDTASYHLVFKESEYLKLNQDGGFVSYKTAALFHLIDSLQTLHSNDLNLFPVFHDGLSFQNYITVKELLINCRDSKGISMDEELFLNLNSLN